eukprot:GHVR01145930.1.p1 GENE.GHVR01145930.1~~GHVR01145930.1.p1  ORF type:complete len:138 (-),score=2.67 GHVR01145930.1:526-939(-)
MLYSLAGHSASICSMANHGEYVSSGGDYGCSSLIIWDVRTWTIKNRVQAHTAAVTCIVDLYDGVHLATASYDKNINIYNYKRSALICNLSSNNNVAIACMIINGDKTKLISSGLDNSISIWKIFREVHTYLLIESKH